MASCFEKQIKTRDVLDVIKEQVSMGIEWGPEILAYNHLLPLLVFILINGCVCLVSNNFDEVTFMSGE